ncbi:MAG TPA: UrcA family protein [Caulobacteraceae bacterium]|nr:UrcA family protein [Caulobacteraceae bacterium]
MIRTVLPAALALAAICGAAQAQTDVAPYYPVVTVSQTVRFHDLDTSTSAGAERLAFRIRTAARSLCGGDNPAVRSGLGFEVCVRNSVEHAAMRLDNPMVSAALHVAGPQSAYARR